MKCAYALLLLLFGSAAAGSGGMWTPDCSKVSSGCIACTYVAPPRGSTTPRGLKQLPGSIADGGGLPVATTSSSLQPADSSVVSGSSSGDPAISTASQGSATAQHSSSTVGSSWSSADLSWGGSSIKYTPGMVLTCTACDTSQGYTLVTTPHGNTHCGKWTL
jgi:hypothetical protein